MPPRKIVTIIWETILPFHATRWLKLGEAMTHSRWKTTDDVLKKALDWPCSPGGADCTMIQSNKTWYLPNTVRDHARCIYAFNSYWKKTKKHGGTCYFNAAAVITDLDPNTRLTWLPKVLLLYHSLNSILQIIILVILNQQPSILINKAQDKELFPAFLGLSSMDSGNKHARELHIIALNKKVGVLETWLCTFANMFYTPDVPILHVNLNQNLFSFSTMYPDFLCKCE